MTILKTKLRYEYSVQFFKNNIQNYIIQNQMTTKHKIKRKFFFLKESRSVKKNQDLKTINNS